jgi:hypothetical protein
MQQANVMQKNENTNTCYIRESGEQHGTERKLQCGGGRTCDHSSDLPGIIVLAKAWAGRGYECSVQCVLKLKVQGVFDIPGRYQRRKFSKCKVKVSVNGIIPFIFALNKYMLM